MSNILQAISTFKTLIKLEPVIAQITNEKQYDEALEMLELVLEEATDTLDDPLNPLIDMISLAIEKYEAKDEQLQLFINESKQLESGSSLVRVLISQNNLVYDDLPEIGTKSAVSKVVNGHRELTKDMIEKLSLRFDINPAYFFNKAVAQHFQHLKVQARLVDNEKQSVNSDLVLKGKT